MANVKITDLTAATVPLAGTELFETVQGGVNKKVAATDIANTADDVAFSALTGRAYISAFSTVDQTGSISAATAIKFETGDFAQGISVANNGGGNPTRITFAAAGTYMIAPSLQFANSASSGHAATIWFRKNDLDLAASSTVAHIPKLADGGSAFFQIVFYVQVSAGQYVEIMWLPSNAAVTLDHISAGAIAPAAPSAIVVAERIA